MSDREKTDLDRQMRRVEALIESLEKLANPAARIVAREFVQTLLTLHRAGLARMLELLPQTEGGAAITAAWGRDDLAGSLLLLHGLHPVDLETRVRQALEQVRPVLRCHGGELQLVAVAESLVRVRLLGSCSLSAEALEHTLEEALATVAPDVQVIEVEDSLNHPETRQRMSLPLVP
jgi:Fe-S cluster biogenesis protein NfuA